MNKVFLILGLVAILPGCMMAKGVNEEGCGDRVYCGINSKGVIKNDDGSFTYGERSHRWIDDSLIAQMTKELSRDAVKYCDKYESGKKFLFISKVFDFEPKQHLWTDVEIKFKCE